MAERSFEVNTPGQIVRRRNEDSDIGILINEDTGEQVDLFITKREEVEIANDISDYNIQDKNRMEDHIKPQATRFSLEGELVKATHKHPHDTVDKLPTDKISRLVKFCNSPKNTFKLVYPRLPFTFLTVFPVNFTYSTEGSSNAITYSLTLDEVLLGKEKPDRGGVNSKGSKEDTGPKKDRGQQGFDPLGDALSAIAGEDIANMFSDVTKDASKWLQGQAGDALNSMFGSSGSELVEATTDLLSGDLGGAAEVASNTIGNVIDSSLGTDISGIVSMTGDLMSGETTAGELGGTAGQTAGATIGTSLGGPIGGQIGGAIGSWMGSGVGGAIGNCLGLPGSQEFMLVVNRGQKTAGLMTFRSPVFKRLRYGVLQAGFDELGVSHGRRKIILNNKILSRRNQLLCKEAFERGLDITGVNSMSTSSLRDWLNEQPSMDSEPPLTFYNQYGVPVISIEGVVPIPTIKYQSWIQELRGKDYEFEFYWSPLGYPVISMAKPDGTPIMKETKVALGSDVLNSTQGLTDLSGVHIIPHSFTTETEITKDNLGNSVQLLVVNTQKKAMDDTFR